jgi:hypothetical protein
MKNKIVLGVVLAGLLLFLAIHPSHATKFEVTGIETTVSLTSFDTLIGLGLTPAPLGTATVDTSVTPPDITFPITGGIFDDVTSIALIEHDGSGFSLTKDSTTLFLEDFLIDTGINQLSGVASFDSTVVPGLPIFDITTDLELLLTSEAAGAIDSIFGVGNLTGAEIGVASLNVETNPVPEPATILLLGSGVLGLAGYSRKKLKK